jgi:GH35 family endo-1,4-beta-xylanase
MSTRIACRPLLMMTLTFSTLAWGVRMPEWIHHRKNPKSAVETAKRRENHSAVAAYYKAKADRLDAEADAYEKAAAAYRNGPYVKNLMAPNQAARYDYIANGLRGEARSYRKREASEENRAKNATASLK